MLFEKTKQLFDQLDGVLVMLSPQQYTAAIPILDGVSIGQHLRHIVEHFQCLVLSRDTQTVNYEERKRDIRIETDIPTCRTFLAELEKMLPSDNFKLQLIQSYGVDNSHQTTLQSDYYRELIFNIEHCIHHQALIRVALQYVKHDATLPETFGYADATTKHKRNVYA